MNEAMNLKVKKYASILIVGIVFCAFAHKAEAQLAGNFSVYCSDVGVRNEPGDVPVLSADCLDRNGQILARSTGC